MPTSIGYQDLAALIARQPAVTERWRAHVRNSTFGTIHLATFSFPRPMGAAIPDPYFTQLASLDPRALDVTGSVPLPAPIEPAIAAPTFDFPTVNRRLKGDKLPLASAPVAPPVRPAEPQKPKLKDQASLLPGSKPVPAAEQPDAAAQPMPLARKGDREMPAAAAAAPNADRAAPAPAAAPKGDRQAAAAPAVAPAPVAEPAVPPSNEAFVVAELEPAPEAAVAAAPAPAPETADRESGRAERAGPLAPQGPVAQPAPAPKAETKPEAKPSPKAAPKPAPKVATKLQSRPQPKPEPQPAPAAVPAPEPAPATPPIDAAPEPVAPAVAARPSPNVNAQVVESLAQFAVPEKQTTRLYFGTHEIGFGQGALQAWSPDEVPTVLAAPHVDPEIKRAALDPLPDPVDTETPGETIAPKGEVTGEGKRPRTPAERLQLSGASRVKHEKCLANAIYFEARGEVERGQMAVAQVILNRAFSGYYPGNVCDVVYQNAHRHLACQFTFACDNHRDVVNDQKAWGVATRVAREALDGKFWLPEIGKATHYHATYVNPWWVRTMTKHSKLGIHIFYRPKRWGEGEEIPVWGDRLDITGTITPMPEPGKSNDGKRADMPTPVRRSIFDPVDEIKPGG